VRRILALLVIARGAAAQPAIGKEFQAGVDAFRLGKLDDAKAHLEKARDLDPKLPGPYRFLAAVAQAQQRWPDCIDNARKALELNPRSGEVADTRKLVEACRASAGRAAYTQDLADGAAITVTTNVPGATVKINGLTYGGTPIAPRPITPGELEVELDKPGYKPVKTTAKALAGVVTDIVVDLEADPDAHAELGTPEKATTGYLVMPPGLGEIAIDSQVVPAQDRIVLAPGVHVVEIRAPGKDVWRRRVRINAGQRTVVRPELVDSAARAGGERLGFYLVGAGGALLVGGFASALASRSAANEAADIVRVERSRDPTRPLAETEAISPLRTRADLARARDEAQRWAIVSDVAYAAGLVTGAVAAYFLYKGARTRTDVPAPFAVSPVSGGAVVMKEIAW